MTDNKHSVEFVNTDHIQGLGVVFDALVDILGDWSMVATKVTISADSILVYDDACEFVLGGLDEPEEPVIEDFDSDEDYWEAVQDYEDECADHEFEINEVYEDMVINFKSGFDLDVEFVSRENPFILSIPIKR